MRSKFWRLVVVGLITWWAVSEWNPPKDRNLLEVFEEEAGEYESGKNKDDEFDRILKEARLKADDSGAMTYDDWSAVLKETELSKYFKGIFSKAPCPYSVLRKLQVCKIMLFQLVS